MADLVTHLCTVLLPGSVLRPRGLALVALGTLLPDLLGRGVPLALEALFSAGVPLPEPVLWPWSALHEPVGWLLTGILLAQAFVEADRVAVLVRLWVGGALHTAVDLLQGHHGVGYLLLAPLSHRSFELGWITSEATVPYALPLAAITAVAWAPVWAGRSGRGWTAVSVTACALGVGVAAWGWTRG